MSSRTAANLIYCPPHLHAQLDLQSGVLHVAYSYFFEVFGNLSGKDNGKGALGALKYMLLCKVMLNLTSLLLSTGIAKFGLSSMRS